MLHYILKWNTHVCDALLALWQQRVKNAEPCHGIRTVVIIGGRHHVK